MKADIYKCACGYGWDKSKVVRHHFCPNCGRAVDSTELEPCTDAISRRAVLDIDFKRIILTTAKPAEMIEQRVRALPSVKPQYTEAEIQRMQEMEQAEIQKAYEIGKAETGAEILDKIRAEIEKRKLNSGGEPNRELAFNVCLQIIDRYKAESEDKE